MKRLYSYIIHVSRRMQSLARPGLPGILVSMIIFGMDLSIRNFELVRLVLEIMVVSSDVENRILVNCVGIMELTIRE